MALPRPAPARRVFRPARRVSWGTRVFAFLVLLVAVGSIGGFLEVFLPQQLATLEKSEASELQLARAGSASVDASVTSIWADLSRGSIGMTDDQLAKDLSLARQTQNAASEAVTHVQSAQAYLAQADGLPFQFHSPAFIAADRATLTHLQSSLNAASKLANAAALQIPIAEGINENLQGLAALNGSLNAHDWAGGARTASTLTAAIKVHQGSAANPETLLDPLWARWIDAMLTVALDAQQVCLASAQGQGPLAQQAASSLAAARNQMAAAYAAAQSGEGAWQAKTVQPVLSTVTREATAAGS